MNEIKEYNEKIFEEIKHVDDDGREYWLARELMSLLEYSKWENFNKVIQKAVVSYRNSNNDDMFWFPEIRKPIITGKGKEEFIKDYKLSRYAYYLIAQNADSRKRVIALAQTYFVIQTRKQELIDKEYSELTVDEKRLYRGIKQIYLLCKYCRKIIINLLKYVILIIGGSHEKDCFNNFNYNIYNRSCIRNIYNIFRYVE